jgi:hypothetical protein
MKKLHLLSIEERSPFFEAAAEETQIPLKLSKKIFGWSGHLKDFFH